MKLLVEFKYPDYDIEVCFDKEVPDNTDDSLISDIIYGVLAKDGWSLDCGYGDRYYLKVSHKNRVIIEENTID